MKYHGQARLVTRYDTAAPSQVARIAPLAFVGLMLACASPATANDGFGALGAGGLIVGHTDQISMVHESLSISQKLIAVKYEFLNQSDREITSMISFPLPSYPAFPYDMESPRAVPANFQIDVVGPTGNGVSHPHFTTRVWAVINGTDITSGLTALGFKQKDLALMPFDEITDKHPSLNRSSSVVAMLRKAGWVNQFDYPQWDVHVAYEWQQTFPPHKRLKITHAYEPFYSGGSASSYLGPNDSEFGDAWLRRRFCASDAMVSRMHALFVRSKELSTYGEVPGTEVDYVLKTGSTWKNGIEDFELSVGPPYELVAFCLNGTNAPGNEASTAGRQSRAIVRHYMNFRPSTDLKILFANSSYGRDLLDSVRPTVTTP